MSEARTTFQPGPAFYAAFRSGLFVRGKTFAGWSTEHGVKPTNLRAAAYGSWNGSRAQELRSAIVADIGPETFAVLFEKYMQRDHEAA
jgi:hypothetical protein